MEQTSAQVRYAGFWARFAARFIDGIIVMIGILVVNFVFFGRVGGQNAAVSILDLLLSFGYYVYMTKEYGATVGKKAIGIHVVPAVAGPLSWGTVLMREVVGKTVSGIIIYIGFIMAAFTEKKRALHDMIAHTYVVYKDPAHNSKALVLTINIVYGVIVIVGIVAAAIFVAYSVRHGASVDSFRSMPVR